ncbi:unnamed protein product [Durusdinium trenchii]|uniref:Uncharacterized protein n=1 Tax=Durusdinium trenchii TaxID=1381693 RepID=A0ABP0IG20_9DINO
MTSRSRSPRREAGTPSASISGVGSSGAFGFLSRASAALSAATLVFSSRAKASPEVPEKEVQVRAAEKAEVLTKAAAELASPPKPAEPSTNELPLAQAGPVGPVPIERPDSAATPPAEEGTAASEAAEAEESQCFGCGKSVPSSELRQHLESSEKCLSTAWQAAVNAVGCMPGASTTLWCPACPDAFLGKWTGSVSKAPALLRHAASASKAGLKESAGAAKWTLCGPDGSLCGMCGKRRKKDTLVAERKTCGMSEGKGNTDQADIHFQFLEVKRSVSAFSASASTTVSSTASTSTCSEPSGNTPWESFVPVTLAKGVVEQRLELPCDGPPGKLSVVVYAPQGAVFQREAAVLCCAGCYECLEGPSCLYNHLASELPQKGYTVIQLAYRPPADDEEEAAEDVMTCIDWLAAQKFRSVLLIGWSMGSAAVIEAAYLRRHLKFLVGVITLAAQTCGTRNAKHLQVPLLALHGEQDNVLPSESSKTLVQRAGEGARLQLFGKDTHRMESALPCVLDFIASVVPAFKKSRSSQAW